jgi:hypothetical protein
MPRRLVVTDNAERLARRAGDLRGAAYLDLTLPGRAGEVLRHLDEAGARPLDRAALFRRHGADFRDRYVRFMGALNRDNASFDWWSHDFATRNALATDLGDNVFYTLLVDRVWSEGLDDISLVVVTESADLAGQLARLARERGITFVRATAGGARGAGARAAMARLAGWLPFWPIAYVIRGWWRVRKVRAAIRPRFGDGPYVVIGTLINHQSFDAEGRYRDTYFGELADRLADSGWPVLVFGALGRDWDSDLALLARAAPPYPVIPIQYFLSTADLLACFARSMTLFFSPTRIAGSTTFDGVDVGHLIERQARRDASRSYFTHLHYHYCARALTRHVRIETFVYPFENRPFEKMYLLAMRSAASGSGSGEGLDAGAAGQGPLLIGYNHATVTPKHLNLVLAPEERDVLPLPDLVLTVGEVTRRWMIEEGGFAPERVRLGCGLRHKMPRAAAPRERSRPLRDVLVVLTAEVDEYLRMLGFLAAAFSEGAGGHRLMIRPHPITPLADALERMRPLPFEFEEVSAPPLDEVLDGSDVVLYTSSTVALEALACGIPVVYLDTGEYLRVDPLVGLEAFRFDADGPEDLAGALGAIDQMTEADYAAAQEAAARYAREYIFPPSDENVGHFMEVLTSGGR